MKWTDVKLAVMVLIAVTVPVAAFLTRTVDESKTILLVCVAIGLVLLVGLFVLDIVYRLGSEKAKKTIDRYLYH